MAQHAHLGPKRPVMIMLPSSVIIGVVLAAQILVNPRPEQREKTILATIRPQHSESPWQIETSYPSPRIIAMFATFNIMGRYGEIVEQ
jgi:hypothetical protein